MANRCPVIFFGGKMATIVESHDWKKRLCNVFIYIYILSKLTGPLVSLWNRHIIFPLFVVAWIWNEITSDSLFFISFFLFFFTETVLIQCNSQWSILIFHVYLSAICFVSFFFTAILWMKKEILICNWFIDKLFQVFFKYS